MENTLLIGNGLNQCLKDGIRWGKLLESIAKAHKVDYNPEILMPLEFERIVNACLQKEDSVINTDISSFYSLIKKEIANMMIDQSLPENAIHRTVPFDKVDNIITTNYDLLLESSITSGKRVANPIANTEKYIFRNTSTIGKIQFFHPHGIVKVPDSICLGYEHYMGVVQKLRDSYNASTSRNGKTNKKNSMTILKEKKICRILKKIDSPKNEWGEKLYTSNVGIIGLGLTECESDLWWILTHRASLYYSNYHNIRDYLNNSIMYFDIVDDIKKNNTIEEEQRRRAEQIQNNRHDLLRHMHVDVKTFLLSEFDNNYENIYRKILSEFPNQFHE